MARQYRVVVHPDRKHLFAIQWTDEPGAKPHEGSWLFVTTRCVIHHSGRKVKEFATRELAQSDADDRVFWQQHHAPKAKVTA